MSGHFLLLNSTSYRKNLKNLVTEHCYHSLWDPLENEANGFKGAIPLINKITNSPPLSLSYFTASDLNKQKVKIAEARYNFLHNHNGFPTILLFASLKIRS